MMNDRIGAALFTTKTHTESLDAFAVTEQGWLGFMRNNRPVYFYPPARPLSHKYFNITSLPNHASFGLSALPKVEILYGYQNLEPALFEAAIDLGAKGVILAGLGAGWWPTTALEQVKKLSKKHGIQVMLGRRAQSGYVAGHDGIPGCGLLDAHKCRIQLQLRLLSGEFEKLG